MRHNLLAAAAKKRAAGGGGYRYLRFKSVTGWGASYPAILALYWIEGATDYPTVAMDSASTPSPLVVTRSSTYQFAVGPYEGWKAFDGDLGTWWNPQTDDATAWITIDLGAGNEITPTGIGIHPYLNYWPREFDCYGSNTGAFAGEETLLYEHRDPGNTDWQNWNGGNGNVRRNFTF